MGFRTTNPAFHAGGPRERNALRNKGPTRRLIDISIPLEANTRSRSGMANTIPGYTSTTEGAVL
jgi:hypothetical protein